MCPGYWTTGQYLLDIANMTQDIANPADIWPPDNMAYIGEQISFGG